MDWRHNQWVGIGAAILVVAGIVFLVMFMGREPNTGRQQAVGLTFLCESTNQTFQIPAKDLEDFDTYMKYFNKGGQKVECKVCNQVDGQWAYYCSECQKFYVYKKGQENVDQLLCPEGHEIADR